jgi:hypothetical protein
MGLTERWVHLRDLRKKWAESPGIQMVKVGYERCGGRVPGSASYCVAPH